MGIGQYNNTGNNNTCNSLIIFNIQDCYISLKKKNCCQCESCKKKFKKKKINYNYNIKIVTAVYLKKDPNSYINSENS